MAQLNDLIVNGYTRFLNSAYGNLNGSATSALCASNAATAAKAADSDKLGGTAAANFALKTGAYTATTQLSAYSAVVAGSAPVGSHQFSSHTNFSTYFNGTSANSALTSKSALSAGSAKNAATASYATSAGAAPVASHQFSSHTNFSTYFNGTSANSALTSKAALSAGYATSAGAAPVASHNHNYKLSGNGTAVNVSAGVNFKPSGSNVQFFVSGNDIYISAKDTNSTAYIPSGFKVSAINGTTTGEYFLSALKLNAGTNIGFTSASNSQITISAKDTTYTTLNSINSTEYKALTSTSANSRNPNAHQLSSHTNFTTYFNGTSANYALNAGTAATVPDSAVTGKDIVKAGYYLTSSNKNTLGLISYNCVANTAYGSLALGTHCTANSDDNVNNANFSFGYLNNVTGTNSVAIGRTNGVTGAFNVALGYGNIIHDKSYTFAIGDTNHISSENAGAFGWNSSAYTEPVRDTTSTFNRSLSSELTTASTACSYPSYSTSVNLSIQELFNSRYRPKTTNPIIPHVSNYDYNGLFYCGDISTPEQYKLALGKNAVAIGRDSIAAGKYSYTLAPYSFVFAKGGIAYDYGQTIVGTWNTPVEDAMFVVGAGYGPDETNSRNNIMEVYRNTVKIYGAMEVSDSVYGVTTSANELHWSSGSDNVLRPIPYADASQKNYFNGNQFYSEAVYTPGFGYNPSDKALYNSASDRGIRLGQQTIRMSGTERDVYSASYVSGRIAGNSYYPFKIPIFHLSYYFTSTGNYSADAGPGYAIYQGITDIYMCSNASTSSILTSLKSWYGTTFNLHNVSNKDKSFIISGNEPFYYYSTYGSGGSTQSTGGKLTVRLGLSNDSSGGNVDGVYLNSTKNNVAMTCFRNLGSTTAIFYAISFY